MTKLPTPIEAAPHPAPWNIKVLEVISQILKRESETKGRLYILDPFAGIGRIHQLHRPLIRTYGVELEPEWAIGHSRTQVGDALNLVWRDNQFDAIVTSPVFGNRMSDHHNARDLSKRNTYKHNLGRDLTAGSSAVLQWSEQYRQFHQAAIAEANRVLRPGGLHIWNVSDHFRKDVEQPVVFWFKDTFKGLGLMREADHKVKTQRQRHGANGSLRSEYEHVLVYRKGIAA